MIKFFRNIRKSLLNEGKTSKPAFAKASAARYFKYAIGEIVLVVIGILIALEVNNWNEDRKTNIAEKLLLESLKDEMIENLSLLEESMSYHEKSRIAANEIVLLFSDQSRRENMETTQIDSLLSLIQWAWTYDPATGVLEAIKTSGHMNSVKNSKLRSMIASYEDLSQDAKEESKLIQDMIVNKYMPKMSNYVSLLERIPFLGRDYVIPTKTKFESNYESLFNDRELESLIAYIHIWRIDEMMEEKNLKIKMKTFIKMIESELNK